MHLGGNRRRCVPLFIVHLFLVNYWTGRTGTEPYHVSNHPPPPSPHHQQRFLVFYLLLIKNVMNKQYKQLLVNPLYFSSICRSF